MQVPKNFSAGGKQSADALSLLVLEFWCIDGNLVVRGATGSITSDDPQFSSQGN